MSSSTAPAISRSSSSRSPVADAALAQPPRRMTAVPPSAPAVQDHAHLQNARKSAPVNAPDCDAAERTAGALKKLLGLLSAPAAQCQADAVPDCVTQLQSAALAMSTAGGDYRMNFQRQLKTQLERFSPFELEALGKGLARLDTQTAPTDRAVATRFVESEVRDRYAFYLAESRKGPRIAGGGGRQVLQTMAQWFKPDRPDRAAQQRDLDKQCIAAQLGVLLEPLPPAHFNLAFRQLSLLLSYGGAYVHVADFLLACTDTQLHALANNLLDAAPELPARSHQVAAVRDMLAQALEMRTAGAGASLKLRNLVFGPSTLVRAVVATRRASTGDLVAYNNGAPWAAAPDSAPIREEVLRMAAEDELMKRVLKSIQDATSVALGRIKFEASHYDRFKAGFSIETLYDTLKKKVKAEVVGQGLATESHLLEFIVEALAFRVRSVEGFEQVQTLFRFLPVDELTLIANTPRVKRCEFALHGSVTTLARVALRDRLA